VLEEISRMVKECEHCDGQGSVNIVQHDPPGTNPPNIINKDGIFVKGATLHENVPCDKCGGSGVVKHPASFRATEVLEARKSDKERELYDKLLIAGRFHASFIVIGTLSSRMAGADKLNAQGIKKTKNVRSAFILADPDRVLCGGDFVAFEVVLAVADFADAGLEADLKSGKKIHAIFGAMLNPNMTYEQVLASAGTADDWYTKGKSGVFAKIYGGEAYTLHTKLGVTMEVAEEANRLFEARYVGARAARMRIFNDFCSMRQPGGLGSKVEWHEPKDYVESMLGFRRYFTLENQICKALFDLANRPPPDWSKIRVKVVRRDREQSASGAVQSALYAAAFAQQAANMRAAANHRIQSSGATITKHVQRQIWDLQPYGVHEWFVQPMNIHDEIMCPSKPDFVPKVREVVTRTVNSYKEKIPLIEIDWSDKLNSWADK
jgi:DNA polymerase I-like protein with 3'-5' exonuclease and polymerase domains